MTSDSAAMGMADRRLTRPAPFPFDKLSMTLICRPRGKFILAFQKKDLAGGTIRWAAVNVIQRFAAGPVLNVPRCSK